MSPVERKIVKQWWLETLKNEAKRPELDLRRSLFVFCLRAIPTENVCGDWWKWQKKWMREGGVGNEDGLTSEIWYTYMRERIFESETKSGKEMLIVGRNVLS